MNEHELKTNEELLNECIHDTLLVLKQMKEDDQNRPKVLNELKTYAEIQSTSETNESVKENNTAKIALDEERLRLDQKKVVNERWRLVIDAGKILFFTAAGVVGTIASYNLDETKNLYRKAEPVVRGWYDAIVKKF